MTLFSKIDHEVEGGQKYPKFWPRGLWMTSYSDSLMGVPDASKEVIKMSSHLSEDGEHDDAQAYQPWIASSINLS